jgi:hypothetical protein
MSCILRVSGIDLNPAKVLRGTTLVIDRTWRKGEPRGSIGPASRQLYEQSGFTVVVSDADGDKVPRQIDDAIAYLTMNASLLEAILLDDSVEDRFLDFAWWFPTDAAGPAVQFRRFPVELLALCSRLRLAIEVSVYGTAEECDEE